MLGLMQDWPLLCHRIIDHAAINHADRTVITRSIEGPIHHTNYAEIRARALRVAQRLDRDGIKLGDRVATLAWNTWRHLESWYGIVGIGAVYHTINPRLFPEQIAWIINHAEDRVMMTDLTFLPLLEKLADKLPSIERYIIFTDAAHMPATSLRNAVAYETWLAEADGDFAWKTLRGKYRRRHVLHLRHHRQSQGRGLFASLERAAYDAVTAAGCDRPFVARCRLADRADVPCQLLGARFLFADGGRSAGHAGRETRRRLGLRTAQRIQGHLHRRRADGLAVAVAASGKDRRQASVSGTGRDRRLGLPARHDQDLRGRLRRRRCSTPGA